MRKALTVVAVLIVVALIAIGVMQWRNNAEDGGSPLPGASPSATAPQGDGEPVNPPGCVAFEVISAPGTWESAAGDDPINPTANPASFMLTISQPLQQRYSPEQVKVWTLPYPAQFKNINSQNEMTYDESRTQGVTALNAELSATNQACPATKFILAGFSQGAVIVGDIAAEIGNGRGVIPADRVAGVAAIADGRRVPEQGITPSVPVSGVGAEVALEPLNLVVQPIVPGATMRGERVGGFGSLNDRVQEICAPDDAICDAPRDISNALSRAEAMVAANGVHAQYATNPAVFPGTTTPQWVLGWATGLIDAG